jgi:hypothetical protein
MVHSSTQTISFLLKKRQLYFTPMLLVRCKDVICKIFCSKTAPKKTSDDCKKILCNDKVKFLHILNFFQFCVVIRKS